MTKFEFLTCSRVKVNEVSVKWYQLYMCLLFWSCVSGADTRGTTVCGVQESQIHDTATARDSW